MGFEASLHQNLIFRSPQLPHTNCVFMHSELDPEEKSSKEFPVEGSERYCDEYMHCNFMEIRFHMEKAFATGRTVLIVDTSEDEKVKRCCDVILHFVDNVTFVYGRCALT